MINIPKHKLEKFGYSIRCNRKRKLNLTKAAKWTQLRFCDDICSQTSLISLEKGNAARFKEVYLQLAERLGLQVAYSEEIDKRIDTYTKTLYTAVEFYEFDIMRKCFDKLYELLESVKNCLWYCDLYQAVKAVDGYYMKRQYLDYEERNYLADMVGEFSNDWDELIKAVIYISAYLNVDTMEYKRRYRELKIEKCKSAFNKINTLLYYYDNSRTSVLLDLSKKYEKAWQKNNNYLRILDIYGIMLPYLSIHDSYEVNRAYKKMKNVIDTHDVPKYKSAECYFGAITAFSNLKNYDAALEACKICYECDEKKVLPLFIFVAHAQRMTKKKVEMPYYSKEQLSKFSVIYQKLYEYFTIVEENNELGEKYILSKIAPTIDADMDKAILKIIREEIGLIANDSNHYKIVAKFNKRMMKSNIVIPSELELQD